MQFDFPEDLATTERQLKPVPYWPRMHADSPIRYDERREVWDVFRNRDIDVVLADHETFFLARVDVERKRMLTEFDPPDQGVLRCVAESFIATTRLAKLPPGATSRRSARGRSGARGEHVQHRRDRPRTVLRRCHLLGLPDDNLEALQRWFHDLVASPVTLSDDALVARRTRQTSARERSNSYFRAELHEPETNPLDDRHSRIPEA